MSSASSSSTESESVSPPKKVHPRDSENGAEENDLRRNGNGSTQRSEDDLDIETKASSSSSSSSTAPSSLPRPASKKSRNRADASSAAEDGDGDDIEFDDPFEDDVDSEDEKIQKRFEAGSKAAGNRKKAGAKVAVLEDDDDDENEADKMRGDEDEDEDEDGEENNGDEEEEQDDGKSDAMETDSTEAGSSSKPKREKFLGKSGASKKSVAFEDSKMKEARNDKAAPANKKVWRAGEDPIAEGEELDYESSAYLMLHRLRVDWPCLSFDILPDALGQPRVKFPHTLYLVTGTQAKRSADNKISVMKCSELHKTKNDDEDSDDENEGEDDDEKDDLDDDPILEEKSMPHVGTVNRIRAMPQNPSFVATWSAEARVYVWNIQSLITALDKPGAGVGSSASSGAGSKKPVHICSQHKVAGYAMDWSARVAGRLATGDNDKNIFLWNRKDAGFAVDATPFKGHTKSVEDLQWSPSEDDVFASASADHSIRIWDVRTKDKSQAMVVAHNSDVNVISWNRRVQHLLASGSDDGSVRVWDLRKFADKSLKNSSDKSVANLAWHKKYITSVEWSPLEESVLAVSGADNQVTIWDLALEADAEEVSKLGTGASTEEMQLPPQLFFVHQGMTNPKELHWHPQISSAIVTTAESGFHIFKPSNMQ